jgi:hypothetical protein
VDNLCITRRKPRLNLVDNLAVLDGYLTRWVRSLLSRRAAKAGSSIRATLSGVLCVAVLIPINSANAITSTDHYKIYAHTLVISHKSYICLEKAWTLESNWNPRAVGNRGGKLQVFGIPQLKNIKLKDMDPYTQIRWGLKYIDHRYKGDPCKLLAHLNKHGWS